MKMSLNDIIAFFNKSYPCDEWFQTHISNIQYIKDDVCKCIIKSDLSYDITFCIKNVVCNGSHIKIELKEFDYEDTNFYKLLKKYSKCNSYELFWIDENKKLHNYLIVGTNTIGNNNGLYLEEIKEQIK